MKREPLTSIALKLRKMTYARKCHYLIVCRNCERPGSERWRWCQANLESLRLAQLNQEVKRERAHADH